jgi:hypothetical protein
MLLRTALAAAAVATLADVTPAAAQFYGDQGFGRQRFWEPRPRSHQQWRGDYADEWGYGGDYRANHPQRRRAADDRPGGTTQGAVPQQLRGQLDRHR